MVVFPNSKINLGLRIVRKRNDGFHDLETIFYPIRLFDVLEVVRDGSRQESGADSYRVGSREPIAIGSGERMGDVSVAYSGITIETTNDNLCLQAYYLLKKDFPQLPPVKMHLHKAIPIGAGLGGGSADAAFALKMLNEKFNLGLTTERLLDYALILGSDCPFFILNKVCYATGRGELLEAVMPDLTAYKFVIVNPGIHINTARAFAGINPAAPAKSVREIIHQPVHSWKNEMVNDFEKTIFPSYPEIETIKKQLYEKGAVYASMSGTGSTVFGIFEKDKPAGLKFPAHYFCKELAS